MSASPPALLDRRLLFVTGKGGVGKSTVAAAGMLWLTDRKGRQVGVPAARIAYVDLGGADAAHRIGFSS